MRFEQVTALRDGRTLVLRNGTAADGAAAKEIFDRTHAETDHLLSYPDENSFTEDQEAAFLQEKTDSENEIELLAFVDGEPVGMAGIEAVGSKYKLRHRAEFGISVRKEYWGCGIGRLLTQACIECARNAGYTQLELSVVGENERALGLYERAGFVEFGRNPRGFVSRETGYQTLVYMRMEL